MKIGFEIGSHPYATSVRLNVTPFVFELSRINIENTPRYEMLVLFHRWFFTREWGKPTAKTAEQMPIRFSFIAATFGKFGLGGPMLGLFFFFGKRCFGFEYNYEFKGKLKKADSRKGVLGAILFDKPERTLYNWLRFHHGRKFSQIYF